MFFQRINTLFGLFSEMLVEPCNQRPQFGLIFSSCDHRVYFPCALHYGTIMSIDDVVKHQTDLVSIMI